MKQLLQLVVDNEPYDIEGNGFSIGGHSLDGNGILRCGGKQLDANFDRYKWAGQRVDPFTYNFTNMIQQAQSAYKPILSQCYGDNCNSDPSQYNWFSDHYISFANITIPISFSLISSFSVYVFLSRKRSYANKLKFFGD